MRSIAAGRALSAKRVQGEGGRMDIVFCVMIGAFFVLAVSYVRWCDRLMRNDHE